MNPTPTTLARRQIWAKPSPTTPQLPHTCSPYRLPSGGTLSLGPSNIITLGIDAVFQPPCPSATVPSLEGPLDSGTYLSVYDNQDPFYTSTSPLVYAISGATIVSYMLVIILFATPRTFYVGGSGGGVSVLGRKGTMGGAYGSNTVIGIGSRPWLQKIAASTLAIAMTIVTADTFMYAEQQYNDGYENAEELTGRIVDGLEIKIARLISESFLWLAQAQTLIRLFQRHREKLVIKWTAFVLISLEVIFTILNQFVHDDDPHQPRAFANSIPALNYLFALALNICYAAFVIVYALRKRRFAFVHKQMQSMPLVALLSLTAVMVPVIFFILDLSKPDVSGWGSYVRWVGACAASVVVWEWVERIEALEREEKKEGILGREVFDGDEMLEYSDRKGDSPKSPGGDASGGHFTQVFGNTIGTKLRNWSHNARQKTRLKTSAPIPLKRVGSRSGQSSTLVSIAGEGGRTEQRTQNRLSQPPAVSGSTADRSSSGSPASTVYAVRYHPPSDPTPPIAEVSNTSDTSAPHETSRQPVDSTKQGASSETKVLAKPSRLARIPIPFRRQRQSPPAEVAAALAEQQTEPSSPKSTPPPLTILDRLHLRRNQNPVKMPEGVIFVPAPPRRRQSTGEAIDEGPQDTFSQEDDSASEGGDDRPPAVVRNAMRRPTSTTPAPTSPSPVADRQISPSVETKTPNAVQPTLEEHHGQIQSTSNQDTANNTHPTNHER